MRNYFIRRLGHSAFIILGLMGLLFFAINILGDPVQLLLDEEASQEAIDAARDSITEGASLAAPLRASGQFPPLVTHMIEVGERSGQLEAMLEKVADTYEEQVETTVSRLTALLEPLLILVMVGIVVVIILATLVPLLQVTSSLG